jgi:hypothetical protein
MAPKSSPKKADSRDAPLELCREACVACLGAVQTLKGCKSYPAANLKCNDRGGIATFPDKWQCKANMGEQHHIGTVADATGLDLIMGFAAVVVDLPQLWLSCCGRGCGGSGGAGCRVVVFVL